MKNAQGNKLSQVLKINELKMSLQKVIKIFKYFFSVLNAKKYVCKYLIQQTFVLLEYSVFNIGGSFHFLLCYLSLAYNLNKQIPAWANIPKIQ